MTGTNYPYDSPMRFSWRPRHRRSNYSVLNARFVFHWGGPRWSPTHDRTQPHSRPHRRPPSPCLRNRRQDASLPAHERPVRDSSDTHRGNPGHLGHLTPCPSPHQRPGRLSRVPTLVAKPTAGLATLPGTARYLRIPGSQPRLLRPGDAHASRSARPRPRSATRLLPGLDNPHGRPVAGQPLAPRWPPWTSCPQGPGNRARRQPSGERPASRAAPLCQV
jgi:hypothetical protein